MSNTSLCTYDGECRHCSPEHMRKSAKELLDGLSSRGETGLLYAANLVHGRCREFNNAINIERYRRGWVNRFWFDAIGCPKFIYEALKDEQGLPEKTVAALRRYEELNHVTKELPMSHSELGVFVEHDRVWTTSRDVAEKFEKNHRDVIRSVKNLDCSEDFRARNFALSSYSVETGNGTYKEYPEYLMTRDGFTFLAMGFTGPKAAHFKEAYIAEFNRMEEELYRRRFCGTAQKQENAVMELPLDRTTFSPALPPEPPKEDYATELQRKYEWEKKRAATAIGNLRASRSNEEKLRHQLNKALDVIAKMASK